MLKYWSTTVLCLVLLSACTNSNQSPPSPPASPEDVYNLDAYGMRFMQEPTFSEVAEANLGVLDSRSSRKRLIVRLQNDLQSPKTAPLSATLEDNKFYLSSSTCTNKSLNPGESCDVTINFAPSGKLPGFYTSSLKFGQSSLPIRVQVVSASNAGVGDEEISFYDGATKINSLDLSSQPYASKISKVISLRFSSAGSKPPGGYARINGTVSLSSNSFYVTSSSCTDKELEASTPPKDTCSFTLNFSTTGKSPGTTASTSVSVGSFSLPLSITIPAPPAPAPASLVFLDNLNQPFLGEIDLGLYSTNVNLSKTIKVKNIGSTATKSLSLELLNNSGYFVSSNSCSNKSLAPSEVCSFQLRASTADKSPGSYRVELKMDQTTQSVKFSRSGTAYESCSQILAEGISSTSGLFYIQAKSQDEKISNGSFDSSGSGWTGTSSYSWSSSGMQSVADNGYTELYQTVSNLVVGKTYKLSAYFNKDSTRPVGIRVYDLETTTIISNDYPVYNKTNGIVEMGWVATKPSVKVALWYDRNSPAAIFWDNVSMKEMGAADAAILTYCDFNAQGAWTLVTRLNTNDGNRRDYTDDTFWESTSGVGSVSDNLDYMGFFANNAMDFSELRLKYSYGVGQKVEATYQNKTLVSRQILKSYFMQYPSNSNPQWNRTDYYDPIGVGFFGPQVIFSTTGDGDGSSVYTDLSRIWYNSTGVGACNQGGSAGHIGDMFAAPWYWEVARGIVDPSCAQNTYRVEVGSNFGGFLINSSAIYPYDVYDNGIMEVFIRIPYYKYGKSCADVVARNLTSQSGNRLSGTYLIDPDGAAFGEEPHSQYCERNAFAWITASPASFSSNDTTGSITGTTYVGWEHAAKGYPIYEDFDLTIQVQPVQGGSPGIGDTVLGLAPDDFNIATGLQSMYDIQSHLLNFDQGYMLYEMNNITTWTSQFNTIYLTIGETYLLKFSKRGNLVILIVDNSLGQRVASGFYYENSNIIVPTVSFFNKDTFKILSTTLSYQGKL